MIANTAVTVCDVGILHALYLGLYEYRSFFLLGFCGDREYRSTGNGMAICANASHRNGGRTSVRPPRIRKGGDCLYSPLMEA